MRTERRTLHALAIASVGLLAACGYVDGEAPAAPRFARAGEGTVLHRLPTITLEGTAEYGAKLKLSSDKAFGGKTAPADQIADPYTAKFTFADVALAPGANVFTLVATDEAGNASAEAKLTVEYVDEPAAVTVELPSSVVTAGAEGAAGTLRVSAKLVPGADGFRLSGRSIVFTLGGVSTGSKEAQTDASGRAEVSFPAFAKAGTGTVTAAIGSAADTRSFVVAGGPAARLKLELAKAGGAGAPATELALKAGEEAVATVEVKDSGDNVLPAPVALFTDAPGALVSGLAISNLKVAGTWRVVAAVSGAPTANGAAVSGIATITVGPADALKVSLSAPSSAIAGETVAFETGVTDTWGNAVALDASRTLTVSATDDAIVTNGSKTVVFKKAGTATLTATLAGTTPITAQAAVRVVAAAPASIELAFSGTARRTTPVYEIDAAADAAISVATTVKDAFGNVLPNAVRLTTNAGGTFDGTILKGLTKAGEFEIRAEVANTLVGARKPFTVLGGAGATIALSLGSSLAEAGQAVSYDARVTDAFGNAAPDAIVVGIDGLAAADYAVDAAARTITVKKAGDTPWVVRARPVAGTTPAAATVPLSVRPAAAQTIAIDVAGTNTYAAGETPALAITVKDAFANTLANPPLNVSIVPQANTVVEPPGPVYSAGKVYNLVRPGTYKVIAQVAGTALVNDLEDSEAIVTVTPGASASLDLTLSRASAEAGTPVDFRTLVRDAYGNRTADGANVSVLQGNVVVAPNAGASWTPSTAGTYTIEAKVTTVTPNLVDRETLVVATAPDLLGPTIAFTRPLNDPTIAAWPPPGAIERVGCNDPDGEGPAALSDTILVSATDPSLVSQAWLRVSGRATQAGSAPNVGMPVSPYSPSPSNGVCAVPSSDPAGLKRGEVLVEFAAADLRGNYRTATGSWCVDPDAANYQPANSPTARCAVAKAEATLATPQALAANDAGDLLVARESGTGTAYVHLFDRTGTYGLGAAHEVKLGTDFVYSPRGAALVGRTAFVSTMTTPKSFIMRTANLTAAGVGSDDAFVDVATTTERFEGLVHAADGKLYALAVPRDGSYSSKLYAFDQPLDLAKKHTAAPSATAASTSLRLTNLCEGARAGEFYATGTVASGAGSKAVVARIAGGTVTTVFTDTTEGRTIGGCALTAAGLATTLFKVGTGASVTLVDAATGELAAVPLLTGYATNAALEKPLGVALAGSYLFVATTEGANGSIVRFARPGGF